MRKAEKKRTGIRSVETGAKILDALAKVGGVSPLGELAKGSNMTPARLHQYLVSLKRSGLVTQDALSGQYKLGPRAIYLGLTALRASDPIRTGFEFLPRLQERMQTTVAISIWTEAGATVVALEESRDPVTMNIRVGSISPLLTTATGQVFAAHLPLERVKPVIELEKRRKDPRQSESFNLPGTKEYQNLLRKIRNKGFASVQSPFLPGLNVLAAPVFDHLGHLVYVVTAVGPRETLDIRENSDPVRLLKESVEELSFMLGYKLEDRETA